MLISTNAVRPHHVAENANIASALSAQFEYLTLLRFSPNRSSTSHRRYGLRYKYGLFKQSIAADGNQIEKADNWLDFGNPWCGSGCTWTVTAKLLSLLPTAVISTASTAVISTACSLDLPSMLPPLLCAVREVRRNDLHFTVRFGGTVEAAPGGGKRWVGGETVEAVAYDQPIPGFKTRNCISLRLWNSEVSADQFDLEAHNASNYARSVGPATTAFELCAVLYPGDATRSGKALRIKQQYFLCSASLQDIMTRFVARARMAGQQPDWADFPSKVAIQMNDTHPTLAAPELMRILMDNEGLSYDAAWAITSKTVAYTNHTVMPEALEKWPLELLEELLPRHVEIIKLIDHRFIALVEAQYAGMEPAALKKTLAAMVILQDYDHEVRSKEHCGAVHVKLEWLLGC